jgi:hypothetical protein
MGVATVQMCLAVTNVEHSAPQSRVTTLGRTYQDHSQSKDATGQALLRRRIFKGPQRWHEPESDRDPDPQSPHVVYWMRRYSSDNISKSRESDNSIQNGIQEPLPAVSVRCQDDPCDIKPCIEWLENNDSQGPSCPISPGLSTKSYEQSRAFASHYSTPSDFDLFSLAFGTSKSTSSVSDYITDCIPEASSHNAKEELEDTWGEIDQNTLEAYLVGWPDTGSPTNQ